MYKELHCLPRKHCFWKAAETK